MFMKQHSHSFDEQFISFQKKYSIALLRRALGIVFLWFGLLKIIGASPVGPLLAQTWTVFATTESILILGILESIIGIGLLSKKWIRTTLTLLWFQLLGTCLTLLLAPSLFFLKHNPLLLTMEGEFIIKNIVFVAAGLVIGGFTVKKSS